jgi:hypothetical protein
LFSRAELDATLGLSIDPGLKVVAFQSDNRIVNTGSEPWSKDRGLLSIWILGMFHPSEQTTVVIPFQPGPDSELGPIVNDAYFGKVPADRLKVVGGYVFFRGDGKHRSKIGIGPLRSKPILGSYDSASHLLTLVQYSYQAGVRDYVNSMWEIQENPYTGDVVNSYNDGPPSPGAEPLGPFYELETSSPAVPLQPGQSLTHVHSTIHMQGDPALLDGVARAVLGLDLATIRDAFD